jgi:glycine cleavage system regulatory protein
MDKTLALICLALLVGGGCGYKAVSLSSRSTDKESTRSYGVSQMRVSPLMLSTLASSRYLAVRHKLVVVTVGADLPKSLDALIAFCGTIQCEVISSNVTNQTGESAPSGSVSMRVRPSDVDKLTGFVGKQGKIAQHTTETEDKTAVVVDTDAKVKNLTEFRDTLRKMLARPGVSVADLVQIQEKLAEVQAQLDSEAAQRKILANETEKVAVEVEFRAERTAVSVSAFRPIAEAVRESASVMSESLASLITAVVAVIPWLIVIVPGAWFVVKAWRRVHRKRPEAEPNAR